MRSYAVVFFKIPNYTKNTDTDTATVNDTENVTVTDTAKDKDNGKDKDNATYICM